MSRVTRASYNPRIDKITTFLIKKFSAQRPTISACHITQELMKLLPS